MVHIVDHRRDRGRLARAGDAGEEDESLRGHRHIAEDRGQVELFETLDVAGDQTRRQRRIAAGHEQVDAEAARRSAILIASLLVVVGEVDRAVALEVIHLVRIEDVHRHLHHDVGRADGGFEILQDATVAHARSKAALDDQVGAFDADNRLKPGDPGLQSFASDGAAVLDREWDEQFVARGRHEVPLTVPGQYFRIVPAMPGSILPCARESAAHAANPRDPRGSSAPYRKPCLNGNGGAPATRVAQPFSG